MKFAHLIDRKLSGFFLFLLWLWAPSDWYDYFHEIVIVQVNQSEDYG